MKEGYHLDDASLQVLQSIPEAVVVIDSSEEIIFANWRAQQKFSDRSLALAGQKIERILPGFLRLPLGTNSILLAAGTDGQRFLVEASLGWFRADEGLMIVLLRDLKQGEDYAPVADEELFRNMANLAPAIIWTSDAEGRCTFVNRAWLDFTGRSLEEEINDGWAKGVHPEDFPRCLEIFQSALADQEPFTMEYRQLRSDGEYRWVLDNAVPRYSRRGVFTGYIGSGIDITERRERAEKIRSQLKEKLRKAHRMGQVGLRAGEIAHDFNNELMVIQLFLSEIYQELSVDDPVSEDLEEIRRAAERARQLARQLMVIGRRPHQEQIDLNAVVKGMEKTFRQILGSENRLEIDLQPDLWLVNANLTQIEQALLNLVRNGREAMSSPGRLLIRTRNTDLTEEMTSIFSLPQGSYVLLQVSDTGMGMDEATRERVFQPFFTTKKRSQGTGLGLSTMYSLIRRSGGDVRVESEPGSGASFQILLPRSE